MTARYLLRFDDICPTMDWAAWEQVEGVLRRQGVRPLLAVVPDNRDPALVVDMPRDDFWERVRTWQADGWAIGLHGHQHRYTTENAGLVGLRARSEFAGLPADQQRAKLTEGLHVFAVEGVRADAWVAPGHTFDATTVQLVAEAGIPAISDGFHLWPHRDRLGVVWVPQQLWTFRRRRAGTWTVCLHHNGWSASDVDQLEEQLSRFGSAVADFDEAVLDARPRRAAYEPAVAAAVRAGIVGRRRFASLVGRG